MIRFQCKSCCQIVQIDDRFSGKQGRCPLCKNVVRIPLLSDTAAEQTCSKIQEPATDDLRALKAACLKEELPGPTAFVPGPPQKLDVDEELQFEQGSHKTTEMPAIQPHRPTLVQAIAPPPRPSHATSLKPARYLTWLVITVGLIVILLAALMIVLMAM